MRKTAFFAVNFDDSSWHRAVAVKSPDYTLFAQPTSVLSCYPLLPVLIEKKEGRLVFADFGREFVGTLRVTAKGRAGTRITVRQGEELNADGSVRFELRCNCRYEEYWTLSGREQDALEQFDYKGFRYAELVLPEGAEILDISAEVRHYPFEEKPLRGPEEAEKAKIFELCRNTLKYGVQETFIDCPTREKGQYFGDGFYISLAWFALTGDAAPMRKMIDDAFLSCRIEPGMLAYGPASRLDEIAEFPLMMVVLVYCEAVLSGNTEYLKRRYSDVLQLMKVWENRYMDKRGLITVGDKWNVVDWPASARDGYDAPLVHGCEVCHAVMNAYWLVARRAVNRMSKLMGLAEEFDVNSTATALIDTFYDEKQGLFVDRVGSLHCSVGTNAFSLLLGLAPDLETENRILKLIGDKKLNHSNLFISPIILAALFVSGKEETANKFILDDACWKNMLNEGATTTFEAFSKSNKANASLFHPAFAFPVIFWAKDDAGAPGGMFRKLTAEMLRRRI